MADRHVYHRAISFAAVMSLGATYSFVDWLGGGSLLSLFMSALLVVGAAMNLRSRNG